MIPQQDTLSWTGLTALPAWSAAGVAMPYVASADDRYTYAGEACVAMVVAAVWGVRLDPESIRAQARGRIMSGLPSAWDLEIMLAQQSVAAQAAPTDAGVAQAMITAAADDWRPCLVRGAWPGAGADGAWLLTTAAVAAGVGYIDPLDGSRASMPWSMFAAGYADELVVVLSHLHVDASTWPLPRAFTTA